MRIFMWRLFRNENTQNVLRLELRRKHTRRKEATNEAFGAQYCRDLVAKSDHENYLCTLLLPGEQRRHAFALRAFNVEVANCATNVSEDQIVKMKLKFWHDSIDKCYDKAQSYVVDHPVLRELKQTVDVHKLNKVHLQRLVAARDRPANMPFQTLTQLEEYAERSFSSLLHLLIQISGVKQMQVDHAVSHLGKAQGIATLLRAIPYKGRTQAISVPQEILIKHGVSQERILRHTTNDKGVEECIFEVATAAHIHLEKARSLMDHVPKEVRKLLLPAVAVERYLERLRVANFRLTNQNCLQRDSMLPLALYWHSVRGRY